MSGEKLIYEEKIRFTYSDFDTYDKILPSILQRFFQDAAGKHADQLGVGYVDMITQGALWIVSKINIVILKDICYDEEYVLRTWPHRKRLIYFPREYEICDSSGDLVVKCMSTWHIFSKESREIMSLSGLNLGMLKDVESIPSNFPAWNIDIAKDGGKPGGEKRLEHPVTFTDLDHNGHMNNTHYSDIALDSLTGLSGADRLKEFKIIFQSECSLGDKIETFYFRVGEEEYIKGVKDGAEVFVAAFRF